MVRGDQDCFTIGREFDDVVARAPVCPGGDGSEFFAPRIVFPFRIQRYESFAFAGFHEPVTTVRVAPGARDPESLGLGPRTAFAAMVLVMDGVLLTRRSFS